MGKNTVIIKRIAYIFHFMKALNLKPNYSMNSVTQL